MNFTLTGPGLLDHFFASVGLIIAIGLTRAGILTLIRRGTAHMPDVRRRWSVMARNAAGGLLLLGFTLIWREEIRSLALSIVALAAAFAIATKEGILCVVGGMLKMSNRSFAIGDRIEVGSARGDVIDYNLMTTMLLEVGPQRDMHIYTGRTVMIPNSLFLTTPIVNEGSNAFVLHVFKVPLSVGEDWRAAEQLLLEAARSECAPYLSDARRHLNAIIKDQGLDQFNIEPRVSVHMADNDRIALVVRIPAPNRKKAGMEQAILRAFLEGRGAFGVSDLSLRAM